MNSHQSLSHEPGALKKVASRGALITAGSQFVRLAVQLAGIAVLARLLDPDQYGLMAMTLAVVGIGEVVRDFGLSNAAVQAENLSSGQKTNLFWINLGIGVGLAVLLIGLAPLIAAFYGNDSLTNVLRVLAATFVINGASAQYRAHLNRAMRFGSLAVAGTAGAVVSLAVAISMALMGLGVWALVGQQLGLTVVPLIVMVVAARWLPGLPRRGQQMRSLVSYGWYLMVTQLVGYASRNVDSVIIGRQFGAEVLGFYDRAFQMLMLPLNQLNAPSTTVALPVLSSLQKKEDEFNRFLVKGQTVMTSVVAVTFAFASAQAVDAVSIFLGPGWEKSALIFQILSIAGVLQAASYATYWVFLAKGLTASNLRFALISRPIVILVILGGSFWGVYGVAVAYGGGLVFNWIFGLWWIRKAANAPARQMFWSGFRIMAIYAIAACVGALVSVLMDSNGMAVRMSVVSLAFAAALLALWVVLPSYRRDLQTVWSFGMGAIRRNRSSS